MKKIIISLILIFGAASAAYAANSELINDLRNYVHYNDYPADVGYLPIGKQLENFFENGQWSEEENNQDYSKNFGTLAVFQGIGRYSDHVGILKYSGRKARITVKFGRALRDLGRIKQGSFAIVSIAENQNIIYRYERDRGLYNDMQSQLMLDFAAELGGLVGQSTENTISLSSFLSSIYD